MIWFVFATPEQGGQPSQYRGKGYGHHNHSQYWFTQQGAKGKAFYRHAHEDRRNYRQTEGGPYREAERHQESITEITADQDKVSLGNVKHLGAFQDDYKANRDEGIDHALGKAGYY
jgi:hypothetical protein